MPGSWATGVFLAWAVIASLALLRVLLGIWQLRRVRMSSTIIDPATLDPRLQRTLREFRSRKVTLAVSERLRVPAAIGFLNPLIVFPAWSVQELSAEELHSVLIHELAHLGRWDDWTNLAQKVLRAVFFFHPAVWWVESQLSLEREMACDDVVLSKTANPREYVQCLVSVAEKSFMRRGLAMAQAAVSKMRQTSRRVAQILDVNRPVATRVWKPALGLVTVFSTICLVVMSRAPVLVGFQDATPKVAMASSSPVSVGGIPVISASWSESSNRPVRRSISAHKKVPLPAAKTNLARLDSQRPAVTSGEPETKLAVGQGTEALVQVSDNLLSPNGEQAVLLVMQTAQYGSSGQVFWTICVWRVTVIHPGQLPSENRIPAKQI